MTHTQCELCSSDSELSAYEDPQTPAASHGLTAIVCGTCSGQIEDATTIDAKHWRCLNESIWSENAVVKVLAWRILTKLSTESWALDLLDQLYLEDDALVWAKAGAFSAAQTAETDTSTNTRDSNGTRLSSGDSVTLIKDLDVKGANFTAKRGLLVKNITLTDDPELIEGRVNGSTIVLKTCFLKKAN